MHWLYICVIEAAETDQRHLVSWCELSCMLLLQQAVLTTMDIVHDGFGLMLAFGDLSWVPFLYCLQARFLLEHPQDWSSVFLVGILALNCE